MIVQLLILVLVRSGIFRKEQEKNKQISNYCTEVIISIKTNKPGIKNLRKQKQG